MLLNEAGGTCSLCYRCRFLILIVPIFIWMRKYWTRSIIMIVVWTTWAELYYTQPHTPTHSLQRNGLKSTAVMMVFMWCDLLDGVIFICCFRFIWPMIFGRSCGFSQSTKIIPYTSTTFRIMFKFHVVWWAIRCRLDLMHTPGTQRWRNWW